MKRFGRLTTGAGSFAAAIITGLLTGGCSLLDGGMFSRAQPHPIRPGAMGPTDAAANASADPIVPPAPPARVALFDNAPFPPDARPSTPRIVNVFGEFDGQVGVMMTPPRRFGPGGFEQVTFLDEGFDTDVSISPDGQWIVFASTRHHERPEIYLQRVGGSAVTQLTSDDAEDAFPVFSPDGSRIAFASTRNGSWDIYVMDADGRNVTQVTGTSNMYELHPSFSPDGTRLVYCATGTRSGQWELWTVDLRSLQRRMIGYGLFPSWSPRRDRDQIAFQRARQRGGRWFSLWTADLVAGEAHRLTEVAVSANAAIVSPAWNGDGTQIAFTTILNPSQDGGGAQQDIWVINADGTGRRRITDGHGVNASPAWSSDNRVYFVSNRGGAEAIWSAQAGPTPTVQQARQPKPDPNGATDPFASSGDE